MASYDQFKTKFPEKKILRSFTNDEISALDKKLPKEIVEFLSEEGLSSYANGLLWTTHPESFYSILSEWGLDGNKCHAFLRTAFGGCIYYFRKKFYSFDSLTGTINCLNDDIYTLLNVYLTFDFLLQDTWHLDQIKNDIIIRQLKQDEILALVPALPLGGSFETSKFEIVKMFEHQNFLAQLFNNKVNKL